MSKICGIYKITSPTGRVYIGQSVNIRKRWQAYRRLDCIKQKKLHASLNKHGWRKHQFEIITECDKGNLDEMEIFFINAYNSYNTPHGMNLMEGGNSSIMPIDVIRKRALAQTGLKNNGYTTSKYIGVSYDKASCRWRATIAMFRSQKRLGVFESEVDAAYAYDIAVLKYHEGKTPMNFTYREREKLRKTIKGRIIRRSSKYHGVIKITKCKYSSRVTIPIGKIKTLGTYKTPIDAAISREKYIIKNKTSSKRNFTDLEMNKFINLNPEKLHNYKYKNSVGVYKNNNKFQSRIKHNGKLVYLGYYNTKTEAAQAYNNYVINNNLNRELNEIL